MDDRKAVDFVYLDFSKAFNTMSHNILLEKLGAHGLDRGTSCWVTNRRLRSEVLSVTFKDNLKSLKTGVWKCYIVFKRSEQVEPL